MTLSAEGGWDIFLFAWEGSEMGFDRMGRSSLGGLMLLSLANFFLGTGNEMVILVEVCDVRD